MKKFLVLLSIIVLTGCVQKNPNEDLKTEEPYEDPYIEFASEVMEVDLYSDFNYKSKKYIKESFGEISVIEGEVDTYTLGDYILKYRVENQGDPSSIKEYEVTYRVTYKSLINEDGLILYDCIFVINAELFEKNETRFTLKVPNKSADGTTFPIGENEIGIVIWKNGKMFLAKGPVGIILQFTRNGTYEAVEGEKYLYKVNSLREEDECFDASESCEGKELSTDFFDSYFYIDFSDTELKLYYFTEYPDLDSINEDTPYFEFRR